MAGRPFRLLHNVAVCLHIPVPLRRLAWRVFTSDAMNAIRRTIGPFAVSVSQRVQPSKNGFRLHVGCGTVHKEDYINIDLVETGATDLLCDIVRLPYRDASASVVEAYHVIEHLTPYDAQVALSEWYRVLAPGGVLILECPNFDAVVQEYLNGDETRLTNIFGLQHQLGQFHFWGYNRDRLERLLKEVGFVRVAHEEARDYHAETEPCIRVVAQK